MHTSATPRFLISVNTVSQCFAPSPPWPVHKPRIVAFTIDSGTNRHFDRNLEINRDRPQ